MGHEVGGDSLDFAPQVKGLEFPSYDPQGLQMMDSMILSKLQRGVFTDFFAASAEIMALVTGWDGTVAELRATTQRIVAARK